MKKIVPPPTVDYSKYAKGVVNPEVYYGLPKNIFFCKNCVMSNQKPNSAVEFNHSIKSKKHTNNFDDEGVCDGCNYTIQKKKIIQGNLSPQTLVKGGQKLEIETKKVFKRFSKGPFIFNLSHGILPKTPVENVKKLIKLVRSYKK